MNDNDELNDSAVLSAVRDSISGLPMPAAPRLQAITARGRACRRRRLGGLSIAGAGACAALAVGLAGGSGSVRPATARAASGPSGGVLGRHWPWRHDDPDPVPAAGDQPRRGPPGPGRTRHPGPRHGRQVLPHGRPAAARRWPGGGAAAPNAEGDRRAAALAGEDRRARPDRDPRIGDPQRSRAQHRLPPGPAGP